MAARLFVAGAIHQQHLAEESVAGGAGDHDEVEEGGEFFGGFLDGVIGRDGKSTAVVSAQDLIETAGLEPAVGVDEKEQLALCGQRALMAGPGLAAPAVGQCLGRDDGGPVGGGDAGGGVGGSVVDDEDFEGRSGLGADGI